VHTGKEEGACRPDILVAHVPNTFHALHRPLPGGKSTWLNQTNWKLISLPKNDHFPRYRSVMSSGGAGGFRRGPSPPISDRAPSKKEEASLAGGKKLADRLAGDAETRARGPGQVDAPISDRLPVSARLKKTGANARVDTFLSCAQYLLCLLL
jgi:hypothetical protein